MRANNAESGRVKIAPFLASIARNIGAHAVVWSLQHITACGAGVRGALAEAAERERQERRELEQQAEEERAMEVATLCGSNPTPRDYTGLRLLACLNPLDDTGVRLLTLRCDLV